MFYGNEVNTNRNPKFDIYQAYIATGFSGSTVGNTFGATSGFVLPTLHDANNCDPYPNDGDTIKMND